MAANTKRLHAVLVDSRQQPEEHTRFATIDEVNTVAAAFAQVAAAHADDAALFEEDRSWTFRQLWSAANVVASHIGTLVPDVHGARVGVHMNNSVEYIASLYGVMLAGAVPIPVPGSKLDGEDLLMALQSDLMLIDRSTVQSQETSVAMELSLAKPPSEPARVRGSQDDLAMLLLSSGTSHRKVAMLSHRNLLANIRAIAQELPIATSPQTRPGETALALIPMQHAFGNSVVHSHLLSGASLVARPPSLGSIVQEPRHFTCVYCVPEQLPATVSECGRDNLRFVAVAGGPVREAVALETARSLPGELFLMYGQTESTARISILSPTDVFKKPASIGKGLRGVELQVVSEGGEQVAPGETGEVRTRSDSVFLGYWQDAQRTADVLRDGWLYTGDLGTVDDCGYVYIKGRRDRTATVLGRQISLAEIETEICNHVEGIVARVITFHLDDGLSRLALFVQTGNPALCRESIATSAKECLPRHHRPVYIEVMAAFPYAASGKVDEQELVARAKRKFLRSD